MIPVICLMMDVVCIALFFPLSWELFAAAALFLAAAVGLQLGLHELGHLLGGKMSGYRLLFLRIGTFSLERDAEGKLRASFGRWRGGQCVMVPGAADDGGDCPYFLYNFGGILFNMITGALGLAGCFIWGMGTGGSLFFLQLLYVGILQTCLNGIPNLRDGVPTDGYVLRLLGREPAVRRDYAAYLQVYALSRRGISFDVQTYDYPRDSGGSTLFYDALQELLREYRAEIKTAPGEEAQIESAPGGEAQTESAPGGEAQTESAPGGEAQTESAPGEDVQTESVPGEEAQTESASDEEK